MIGNIADLSVEDASLQGRQNTNKEEILVFEDSAFPRMGTNFGRFYARQRLQFDGYAQVRDNRKLVDVFLFRIIVAVVELEQVLAVVDV